MALINCPECKKEISDKSKVCIYCGYPIDDKNVKCIVNGVTYDLSFLLDKTIDILFKAKQLHLITKCDIEDCIDKTKIIVEKNEIPKTLFLKEKIEEKNNFPHCPTCNSTNLKKISGLSKAGSVAIWGILAAGRTSKTWHCNNCGTEW